MKWLRPLLLGLALMLAYTGAMAFESPSGYQSPTPIFAVDYSYVDPVMPASYKAEAQTEANSIYLVTNCNISSSDPAPVVISKQQLKAASLVDTKPQRGYIRILFS